MENKIIIDANFFISLFSPHDSNHKKAEVIFSDINNKTVSLYTNNYLVAEVYTVLLLRTKHLESVHAAHNEVLGHSTYPLTIHHIGKEEDKAIYDVFSTQNKYKGGFLSYADCSLVVQARKQHIKTILTFDTTLKQYGDEFTIMGA